MAPSASTSVVPSGTDERKDRKSVRRHVTLYDAVAGRVATQRSLSSNPARASPHRSHVRARDTVRISPLPVPPEAVLFRRLNAPDRYEEDDIYFADPPARSALPSNAVAQALLPDSDLVKAIHAYAADYYGRVGSDADFASLDETALLAIGVLMEELADEALGETGDLALVEGETLEAGLDGGSASAGEDEERRAKKRRKCNVKDG